MFGVIMEYGRINKQILSPESAAAGDIFDQFTNAQTFKSVQGTFRLLCDTLRLKPTNFPNFYPKLKAKLRSWKAQALWSKFDKRASHRCYNRGKACANVKVLIIGAGPCGLRAAIEAQLLGAKVVVIEKRDRFSRNNVLHLWPFVIQDLRNLGAKKFYGKFCAGAIDHISIRQLQCVLLKVALLLGVEVHENVAFDDLIEPPIDQSQEKIGWKALVTPTEHPLSLYEFDVLIGADGKRNTLKGFKRKEFRGKLAIAITANFINRHSEAEARVQEISGVAFIFNQKFFQDLRDHTGIDLENIVYYKDETHYFVMTAKKYSLIEKGVILNDYADTARLLAPENVSKEALFNYAREAADFSTNFQMPNLEFAVNHYGQEDVAMFDFTSMYAAESACRVVERRGHKLLQALVGDSLLEPFWPTGSGCARGFLSSMDTCWMIRSWALGAMTSLQVLAERESIFRLLAQTTPENLSKDYNDYSLNPASRYPNLNSSIVRPAQVRALYDTDGELKDEPLDIFEMPKKKRKRDSLIHPDTLLNWCQRQVISYNNVSIENMTSSWKNGLALAAIVHRYRPDLIDFHSLTAEEEEKNIQLAFDVCEREFAIHPVITAKEMTEGGSPPDALAMVSYISQVYETFRGEIPHVARAPMVDLSPEDRPLSPSRKSPIARLSFLSRFGQRLAGSKKRYSLERSERGRRAEHDKEAERERADILRRIKKRRSMERDRALFIMNKDSQQATLTCYKKTATTMEDRENFTTRVKDLEEKLYGVGRQTIQPISPNAPRVIGKLDRGDWNVRMLEEKLKGQKPNVKKERQEVPKWNRDMFEDKLRAMDQRGKGEHPVELAKYSAFDSCLQMLDRKLKEGNNLDVGQRGSNKVSTVAGQLASILDTNTEPQPLQRSNSKPCLINTQNASETCHFCTKRIYLMERQSAHGKFFHRGCFKCECCGVALRLSSYGLATVGPYNGKFLCLLHSGMRNPPRFHQTDGIKGSGETIPTRTSAMTTSLDLPDVCSNKTRGVTPERVEFENTVEFTSDEELLSEIDEDEWTDRNFGMSANEYESSDDESDFSSDEIASENEEELEEAFQNSLTANETLKLAQTWKRRYFKRKSAAGVAGGSNDDDEETDDEDDDEDYDESDEEFSYEEYENEDEDDESTATEGEILGDDAGESQQSQQQTGQQADVTLDKDETKNGDVHLEIPQPFLSNTSGQSVDYQALKSSETEETGSDGVESEEFTETESEGTPEGDADDEDEERKRLSNADDDEDDEQRRICRRESAAIPTIVIDETTTKPPNEDDDAYFVTLQEQNLIAERTLEDLIVGENSQSLLGSAVQTPEELQWVQEDIRPLVTADRDHVQKLEQEIITVSIIEEAKRESEIVTQGIDANRNVQPEITESPDANVATILKTDSMPSKREELSVDSSPEVSSRTLEVTEAKKKMQVVAPPLATESPTAKMMLKLKERYLLGSSDNNDGLSSSMSNFAILSTPTNSSAASQTLEPAVKSCLELISEKQRMLSQSPPSFTSDFRLRGLAVDISPSSIPSPSPSSSVVSASPSSPDSTRLKMGGSNSSWSTISPISPLVDRVDQEGGPRSPVVSKEPLVEDRGPSPDLFDDAPPLTPISSSSSASTTADAQPQKSIIERAVAVQSLLSSDAEANARQEAANLPTTAEEAILETEESINPSIELSLPAARIDETEFPEADIAGEMVGGDEIPFEPPDGDKYFEMIDSSNITFRKKVSDRSMSVNGEVEDCGNLEQDKIVEELPDVSSLENISTNQDEENNQQLHQVIAASSPPDSVHSTSKSPAVASTDHPQDHPQVIKIAQPHLKPKAEAMTHLAKPEDDDSLMAMSNSSDSDAFPSLDEKIFSAGDDKGIAAFPKLTGYVGFSEQRSIFPFGGSGVRDSINIKKLGAKKLQRPFGQTSKLEGIDGAMVVESKADLLSPVESSTQEEKHQDEESHEDNQLVRTGANQTPSSKTAECLEEIPFADDESSHHSSASSPEKKDQFFVEQRKFKRSLQRPLSMVETFLYSTSPPLSASSKRSMMLADTPLTNPDMFFCTPKTMKEAVDDLRQIRTEERERVRQEARERARLKSDEELGLQRIDYTVLKKKYLKPDGKFDFNIEEETCHPHSSSSNGELQIDTSSSQQLPSVHSSSSPDSEVFEQDIEIAPLTDKPESPTDPSVSPTDQLESPTDKLDSKTDQPEAKTDKPEAKTDKPEAKTDKLEPKTEKLEPKTDELELVEVLESEKESKQGECVQSSSPDASSCSKAPSTGEATKSESTTSTTSKTDHPSSYLEPDSCISVEEISLNMPASAAIADGNASLSKENMTVAGLISSSKKDKQKRKSFLSLFSNFGKGKEKADDRKNKEKSPSPPSASSPQGACGGETPQTLVNPLSPLECNNLKVDGIHKESRFPKLRLARSKEKIKEKLKEKEQRLSQSSKEGSCSPPGSSSTLQLQEPAALSFDTRPRSFTRTLQSGSASITLDRHSLIASMASISSQLPVAERVSNGVAPQATEDSFSDNDINNVALKTSSQEHLTNSAKKTKDVSEDRRKKFQKIAQRVYRQQEQKRLRMAQEIQRQLEELEIKQRDMEARGVQVEKALRDEGEAAKKDEAELMQEWFQLIHTKNILVRQEQELMVKAKELELEDRHSRLQNKLHERMAVDDANKTPAEIEEEGQILTEMLEIVEQRDNLIALMEENRLRHEVEDKDLELSMQAKGMNLLPT